MFCHETRFWHEKAESIRKLAKIDLPTKTGCFAIVLLKPGTAFDGNRELKDP
jgi:hypothetical protein